MAKYRAVIYHLACISLIVFLSVSIANAGEGFFLDEPAEYSDSAMDGNAPDTTDVSIKRMLVGGWGTVIMALFGFTGLFLILYSGGGDSGGRENLKSESHLLYGSICLVITLMIFLYRVAIWWNRTIGRDKSF